MFSAEIQLLLKKHGFDLACNEENIWILEEGEQSVTVSGNDILIEAIWQNYDGDFEDLSGSNIDTIIEWSKKMMKK